MAKCVRYSNRASRVPRNPPDSRCAAPPSLRSFVMTMEGGFAGPRPSGSLVPTRSEVIATQGMAATSHPLASQVALDVLKRGGSAVDAAIAANATLGLMEPTGNGVGGDLFAIVWDAKTQEAARLNGSGRSPQVADAREAACRAQEAEFTDHPAAPVRCRCRCRARWMAGSSCTASSASCR